MIANWVLGANCDPHAFATLLKEAPWTCVVLVMSTAVADQHPIWKFLQSLSDRDSALAVGHVGHWVLEDKAVYRLSDSVFVALNKAKIQCCEFRTWNICDSAVEQNQPRSRLFGTLHLTLDTTRQKQMRMVVGVLDLRDAVPREQVKELAAWIVNDRIALVTGRFGNQAGLVEDLARQAGAIYTRPFFQGVRDPLYDEPVVHPSYFLVFGYHRQIRIPDPFPAVAAQWQLGEDIWDEMIQMTELPWWPMNQHGSAFVPNLGKIIMKPVDWKRYCPNMFQTCLWLGTSLQGRGAAERSQRKAKGKGEKVGKDEGEGKGKKNVEGKGKGKQKDKGKGKDKLQNHKYQDDESQNYFDYYIS
jgi:hypothetical protein